MLARPKSSAIARVRIVPPLLRAHVADSSTVDVPDVLRTTRNAAALAVCYAAASRFNSDILSSPELPPAIFLPGALLLTAPLLTPLARWWIAIAATLAGHVLATAGDDLSF